jgi:hypothetical protein
MTKPEKTAEDKQQDYFEAAMVRLHRKLEGKFPDDLAMLKSHWIYDCAYQPWSPAWTAAEWVLAFKRTIAPFLKDGWPKRKADVVPIADYIDGGGVAIMAGPWDEGECPSEPTTSTASS